MGQRLLSRFAARMRRSLGYGELSERLDRIEQRVAAAEGPRYPSGPLYLGDHLALVATRWGAKMVVDTRDALLAPWLLLDGLWESHLTGWMHDTLREGDTFVDVGANIGYFTLLAARLVGQRGAVVAVEAHPGTADLLRRNLIMNSVTDRATVWQRAAWSDNETLTFNQRARYAANSSVGSLPESALSDLGETEVPVAVEGVKLDDLLSDLPRVDVMKVDVEGAEVHAFRGLERTLKDNPDVTLVFEWSPAQIIQVGDRPEELVGLLSSRGFKFRLLERGLEVIDRAGLLGLDYGNVIAER